MIELEVFGAETRSRRARSASAQRVDGDKLPPLKEMRRLCTSAAAAVGIHDGHIAIEFVDEQRMTELNASYGARRGPTDVLSFPVDGAEPMESARELGDVIICVEHTVDVCEAIVHGVLHLAGMDHETDEGEMLALQRELLARERS